jgi:FkbM family methyltransferase
MDRLVGAAGFLSRSVLPRGRGRLAQYLMRHGPGHDIAYKDQWGYRRESLLTDRMEAYGFTGVRSLPACVARRIRPGDWVVDAGANVGVVTAELCHRVGACGMVWAIEPVPRNVARLRQLKDLNHLESLIVFPGALSDVRGTAQLRLPVGGESAYASFTKSIDMSGVIDVTTWTLDDLVFDRSRDRALTLVKIDVEGFEPQAIAGAERTLRELKPLVLCEFNDILLRDAGSSSKQLLELFARVGYTPVAAPGDLTNRVADLVLSAVS